MSESASCGYQDCSAPKGRFVPQSDGNLVFNFQLRHNGNWHHQGITLKQMLTRAMDIDPIATSELVAEICCVNRESVLNT